MLYQKVTCPLKCFEVELTEEYKQMLQEGWKVEGTTYNQAHLTVTFLMVKDENQHFPNGDCT